MFFAETVSTTKASEKVRFRIARKALTILQFIEEKANVESRT
jgi:hypothetical protein